MDKITREDFFLIELSDSFNNIYDINYNKYERGNDYYITSVYTSGKISQADIQTMNYNDSDLRSILDELQEVDLSFVTLRNITNQGHKELFRITKNNNLHYTKFIICYD